MITKPTRITSTSATLIDHIFTNDMSTSNSGIIIADISDHFGSFYIAHTKHLTHASDTTLFRRKYSQRNIDKFVNDLDLTDFTDVTHLDCPNEAYNVFIDKFNTSFEEAFPATKCNHSTRRRKIHQPWITTGFKVSVNTKSTLYRKYKQNPTDRNTQKYKTYNCIFNRVKRKLKCDYYAHKIEQYKSDTKSLWAFLNQTIGNPPRKTTTPVKLITENGEVTGTGNLSKAFNNHFTDVCKTITASLPSSSRHYTSYLTNRVTQTIYLEEV